jgi:hypothetical protein
MNLQKLGVLLRICKNNKGAYTDPNRTGGDQKGIVTNKLAAKLAETT